MATRETSDQVDKATVDAKAAGTMAGGAVGALIGGAVAGPLGAGVGAVVGSAVGGGAGAAIDYREVESEFRGEWERGPYKSSSSWDDASSAYRYGWDSYDKPEFHGRTWEQAREDLERGWSSQVLWADYEPMVRSAWVRRAGYQTEAVPEGRPN